MTLGCPHGWDGGTAAELRSFLEQKYGGPGGAGRAWRVAMDVKAGNGPVSRAGLGRVSLNMFFFFSPLHLFIFIF